METSQQDALLGGNWTHSFEEDANGIEVFRPSNSFPFPPSRRPRQTLEFTSGGQASIGTPGPDDRLQAAQATVQALGMNRYRLGDSRVIEVVERGPDVLRIRVG